jgi:hypothetical protein
VNFNGLDPHQEQFFRIFFTTLLTEHTDEELELLFKSFVINQHKTGDEKNSIMVSNMKEGISYFFRQERSRLKKEKSELSKNEAEKQQLFHIRSKMVSKILEKSIDAISEIMMDEMD